MNGNAKMNGSAPKDSGRKDSGRNGSASAVANREVPALNSTTSAPMGNSHRHTISLYVANKPGVLIRVSLVFARRAYNIDSLVVSESNDPNYSMMNIVASGDKTVLGQILHQLNKLVDVVHATDRTGEDIIEREMALVKIHCEQEIRVELLQLAQALGCETVDLSDNSITFQVVGETEKIENAKKMFAPYGVRELVRTGKVLMARGEIVTA